MSITTNFAQGTNGTFETKASYLAKRQYHAMCTALHEGTLGRAFQKFRENDPRAAQRVIQAALMFWAVSNYNPTYRLETDKPLIEGELVGIGAYAHSFTEIVAQMAEPHLSPMVNHFGHNAWMLDAWVWFAQNIATVGVQTDLANHSIDA